MDYEESMIRTLAQLREAIRTSRHIYVGGGVCGWFKVSKKAARESVQYAITHNWLSDATDMELGWVSNTGSLFLNSQT